MPMWNKDHICCLLLWGLSWTHKWHLLKLAQLFFCTGRRQSCGLTQNWIQSMFSLLLNSGSCIRKDPKFALSLKELGTDMKPCKTSDDQAAIPSIWMQSWKKELCFGYINCHKTLWLNHLLDVNLYLYGSWGDESNWIQNGYFLCLW